MPPTHPSTPQVLRKSRPPPQQQKILLHDVACALSQLHSMGLVQNDIRPANVMFFGWVQHERLTGCMLDACFYVWVAGYVGGCERRCVGGSR